MNNIGMAELVENLKRILVRVVIEYIISSSYSFLHQNFIVDILMPSFHALYCLFLNCLIEQDLFQPNSRNLFVYLDCKDFTSGLILCLEDL